MNQILKEIQIDDKTTIILQLTKFHTTHNTKHTEHKQMLNKQLINMTTNEVVEQN